MSTHRAIKIALTKTLKCIKKKLGGHPTVYRSGRGYHIIQPIDCPVNLDTIDKFAALVDDRDVNKKFLQFAERHLTGNKNDIGHHPAMRSCMLRVPRSLNSKCKEAGIDAEVKIIQRWDGHRPDYRLLIGSFYSDLVGKKTQRLQNHRRSLDVNALTSSNGFCDCGPIAWIEKLLQTSITDYRKHARDLILVPYLVLRRGITNPEQICDIVMQWADRCAELRRLDPSRREFEHEVRTRVREVEHGRISHMSLERLKEKDPDLYKTIQIKLSGDI